MSTVRDQYNTVDSNDAIPFARVAYGSAHSSVDFNDLFDTSLDVGSGTVNITELARRMYSSAIEVSGAFSTETTYSAYLLFENIQLRRELDRIKEKIEKIEKRLPKDEVIILRDISKDDAKNEIKDLFSSGKVYYYSDITQELNLDLELVVEICNELSEEGEIGIDA